MGVIMKAANALGNKIILLLIMSQLTGVSAFSADCNNENGRSHVQSKTTGSLKAVSFSFQPMVSGVQSVYVAGTFNDWNGNADRMHDLNGDGIYETTLLLPPGRYLYKIVVDGQWLSDPNASQFESDGRDGRNSILMVDDTFQDVDNRRGDGSILTGNIPLKLDYTMVNPLDNGRVEFWARANQNDVDSVHLIYIWKGDEKRFEMVPQESDMVFQYFRGIVDFMEFNPVHFTFQYRDGDTRMYATPSGFMQHRPEGESMFLYDPGILTVFKTPDWAKHGIFYQIFPDRFRNGDSSNDQDFSEKYYEGFTELPDSGKTNDEYFHFVEDWKDIAGLSRSPYRTDGRPDYYSFYGGDIVGVMEKLPYLSDLGVTIIYFNPLNEAKSNHKYDPVDYLKIDPHFADEKTFQAFVKKAHEYGIRIIVDMAFNHTGDWHFAFVDTREKGEASQYWHWFEWNRWPLPDEGPPTPCDYYSCWWGFPLHPNLNFDLSLPNDQENDITDIARADPNMDVVNYILEVPRYWLGVLDIDGFRLDVTNEVPFWFWKEFRRVVDEVKPDAFLIAEIWGDAMPWLGPHGFHSTMNYKYFRDPVLKFIGLGQGDAESFDREMAPGRNLYPIQAAHVMMNLVGSHDTERFLHTVKHDVRRLNLSALFQMTYPGIPHIYYGDEIALAGSKDPDNRRPFPWDWEADSQAQAVLDFYKRVTAIRHQYPALRTGRFKTMLTQGKIYGFLREDDQNRILIVLNNDLENAEISIQPAEYDFDDRAMFRDELNGDLLTPHNGKLLIKLQPLSGTILVPLD